MTNGAPENQLGKLRRTGLANVIDGCAVSGAEGIRKPELGLFQIAAQRCGAALDDGGWMVGDNLIADIQGARRASLRTIWIDRGTWPGDERPADYVVTDAVGAMAIIAQYWRSRLFRRADGSPIQASACRLLVTYPGRRHSGARQTLQHGRQAD
ncbi:HAD family hydrolase [Nonomuraea sp. NPDC050153]|uniref:HAD family hydrolase n=1 Tax=Nonomuraea sp. NPDC050153 TaxID=3364359 RepID=UPI0037A95CE8